MSADSLSLTERLAQHLARPVDAATRARARLHLLDWLGCVAGARSHRLSRRHRRDFFGPEHWLGNVLEMDDVHREARLHPGPVIWPAALSTDDLNDVLRVAVIGYEAMICVGATLDDYHYARWHPTATAGVFGAAAAFLVDASPQFDQEKMVNALGLAGSVTGGLWRTRHENDDAKQFNVVQAIARGSDAAGAAIAGAKGPRFILEGEQGVYAAMTSTPKPLVLAKEWRIAEVSFKPWAACRHTHPSIDCALELRKAGRLRPPFQVATYRDALTFCNRPHPKTELEAKFSLQHAVAIIAAGREAGPEDFTPKAIAALAYLRAQVTVAEAPSITARYPTHFGASLNGFELVDTRGDPERPASDELVIAKARKLIAWGGLTAAEADRAVRLALESEDGGEIDAMLDDWLK